MTSRFNTEYIKVASNETRDFYVAKLRSGWYTFATQKDVHPASPEGRVMASFTTKREAVHCAKAWSTWVH